MSAQDAEDRIEAHCRPRRVRHVHGKDETPAVPQHPVRFGQQMVVGVGRPTAALLGVRLGVLDRHARDGAVKALVGPVAQPRAEVRADEWNLICRGGRLDAVTQFADGLLVGGGAVRGDYLRQAAAALFPKAARQLTAAAAQVKPVLAGVRVHPIDGDGQQFLVGRQLVLSPECLGAGRPGPVVRFGRQG